MFRSLLLERVNLKSPTENSRRCWISGWTPHQSYEQIKYNCSNVIN